jgi:glycosyltransferase involved in cell wall biosynthesis
MHLFVNSLAATAGGGLTYVRNVLPLLSARAGLTVTVAATSALGKEFHGLPNVTFLEVDSPATSRFRYEQSALPQIVREARADVLLSTGNFALRKSPVPQVLLSRNSIYLSADYYRDLLSRHEYRSWLETRVRSVLAKKSIEWADVTVAPSEAFAAQLRDWTGRDVVAIHHGFDIDAFRRDTSALSPDLERKVNAVEGFLKLLFVSHYNYYRNFETLFRALPLIRDRLAGVSVKLLLTCRLTAGTNPGTYNPETAAKLVHSLGVSEMIVELGAVSYQQLHHLYECCDVYVTPAYTETFAHPLVEAMASGIPVVASDIAVHREICSDAAEYFRVFSPEDLANAIVQVVSSPEKLKRMVDGGQNRAQQFSWQTHVDKILAVCEGVLDRRSSKSIRCERQSLSVS